jgi:hypothetical protein
MTDNADNGTSLSIAVVVLLKVESLSDNATVVLFVV